MKDKQRNAYLRIFIGVLTTVVMLLFTACPQIEAEEMLASFEVTLSPSIIAGEAFMLTATAVGNKGTKPLTTFNGEVILSVTQGTLSVGNIFLMNGRGVFELTLSDAEGSVVVELSSGSIKGSASMNVIAASNEAPIVTITTPEEDTDTGNSEFIYDGFDDARGMWYKDVQLSGLANDAEDGSLAGTSLLWSTNRDDLQVAELGTGATLTVRLYSNVCTGTWHDVSLSAADSDANVTTAIRKLFIWTIC